MITRLISILPMFLANRDMIAKKQSVKDIIREVKAAHQDFAPQYDLICEEFATGNTRRTAKMIFDFCMKNLPYEEETKEMQTTRSPAGILTMADMGFNSDCKHYAGFAAGILDALNRAGLQQPIEWTYRFCSYNPFDSKPAHVYVVITEPTGDEIWLDPAPTELGERSFNDRDKIPSFFKDEKPTNMSLMRLSGCRDTDDAIHDAEVVGAVMVEPQGNLIMDFIKRNPTQAILIGGVLAWGLYEILKPKNKRA